MTKLDADIEIFWSVAWNEKLWKHFEGLGRTLSTAKGFKTYAVGPILNDVGKKNRIFTLYCSVEDKKPKRILCHLDVGPKPSGRTPAWVVERNATLQGQGGFRKLLALFEGARAPIARFEVNAVIPGKAGWKCRLFHSRHEIGDEGILSNLGKVANREQVGYRFVNGVLGMDELSIFFDHEDNEFSLFIRANAPLEISPHIEFPFVEQLLKFVVPTCFVKKRTKE